MEVAANRSKIELIQGDITKSDADAIVNAANSLLIMGSGATGCHKCKGWRLSIQEDCDKLVGYSIGDAAVAGGKT